MKPYTHMAIWLDYRTARIYGITRQMVYKTVIEAPDDDQGHVHHHAGTPGSGHHAVDTGFLQSISAAMEGSREVLLLGPADAKHALKSYLLRHRPQQAAHVMGIEPMDHAGDAEIIAAARRFFARADRIALIQD
jgi:hypothetical protein